MINFRPFSYGLSIALLSGCSLAPVYEQPPAPIPTQWDGAAGEVALTQQDASAELPTWDQFIEAEQLQGVIELALENNRDLTVAALNLAVFQAQYRIQGAARLPGVGLNATGTRARVPGDLNTTGEPITSSEYGVNLGISAWELDFFDRIGNLTEAALQQYMAQSAAYGSVRTSLIANVADSWLTLQANLALRALAQETLSNYQRNYDITNRSYQAGNASALDLSQARTALDSTRVALATYQRAIEQGRHGLQLLVGTPVPLNLLPDADGATALFADASLLLGAVPAGLPSQLLQRRPDIVQAEHELQAANAQIGAARAALFPAITLTAAAGTASAELDGLFESGSRAWSFAPALRLPIFNGGALRAQVEVSQINRDIAVANYEQTIQTAFREVADGLSARTTYQDQVMAQQNLVASTQRYYELAEKRYRSGVDSYLTLLDAQRQLFSSKQTLINSRLAQLNAEVQLFRALGGGF